MSYPSLGREGLTGLLRSYLRYKIQRIGDFTQVPPSQSTLREVSSKIPFYLYLFSDDRRQDYTVLYIVV